MSVLSKLLQAHAWCMDCSPMVAFAIRNALTAASCLLGFTPPLWGLFLITLSFYWLSKSTSEGKGAGISMTMYSILHLSFIIYPLIVLSTTRGVFAEHSLSESGFNHFGSIVKALGADITGGAFNVQWIGFPDFNTITEEYGIIPDAEKVMEIEKKSFQAVTVAAGISGCIVAVALGDGLVGLVLAGASLSFIYFTAWTADSLVRYQGKTITGNPPLPIPSGIYRLSQGSLTLQTTTGVAWVADGNLYTRYHITKGAAIDIEGVHHYPSFIDRHTDRVAYGPKPVYLSVEPDARIHVALAGPYSNAIRNYVSRATMIGDEVYHMCPKNIPGTSGSPIFREITSTMSTENGDEKVTSFAYVGSTGSYRDYDFELMDSRGASGIERMRVSLIDSNSIDRIFPGAYYQIFDHCGSGKTHTYTPDKAREGIAALGLVIIACPTKLIAESVYSAIRTKRIARTSLLTSTATGIQRGSRGAEIQIMAHDTLFDRLMSDPVFYDKPFLCIIDEAHYENQKTRQLLDILRNRCIREKKISLIEMTATGYNIATHTIDTHTASNYAIEDVPIEYNDIPSKIVDIAIRDKVLVFVTSLEGTSDYTAETIHGRVRELGYEGESLMLSSKTFTKVYKRCRSLPKGIIYTTDLSELGVNFNPLAVIDFRKSYKMVKHGHTISLKEISITQASIVQRRARCGRERPGEYYYIPGSVGDSTLPRAEDLDRKVFLDAFGLDCMEHLTPEFHPVKLSKAQYVTWSTKLSEINSPMTVGMLTNKDGTMKTSSALKNAIAEWMRTGNAVARGMHSTQVSWWDDRDRAFLQELLVMAGCQLASRAERTTNLVETLIPNVYRTLKSIMRRRPPSSTEQEINSSLPESEEGDSAEST